MNDLKNNLRKAFCLGNFWCLAFSLAYGATLALTRNGTASSQKSILILLAFFFACSWLGQAFYRKTQALQREQGDWALASTSVFAAGALGSLLTRSSGANSFFLLPFLLVALFRLAPQLGGRARPNLERLATLLCQGVSLSLLIHAGPYFGLSFLAGVALVLAWHGTQSRKNLEDYPLEKLALLSPVMAFWFFAGASNQISALFPKESHALLWIGLAASLALAGIPEIFRRKKAALAAGINRLCLALFAASLLFDLNVAQAMATPLEDWDFHWWVHVAPGLDAMYGVMRPFESYAPIEGAVWAAWLPRAWFVALDGSVAGYQVLFALLSLASQGLYVAAFACVLWKIGGMRPFEAAVAAALAAIANLALLQTCYPFPGGWSVGERSGGLFLCVLAFLFYVCRPGQDEKRGQNWLAAGLGALHMLSFFLETLLGLGAIAGLLGVMALAPAQIPRKKFILIGGFGVLFTALAILRPPLFEFFVAQPVTLTQSGLEHMDPSGRVSLFAIFHRARVLSTLHYSFPLAAMIAFLALLPFKVWRHKAFALACYLFLITFFMFISGGQRYFGDPEGTCGAVHFAALSAMLSIPLAACVFTMAWDLGGRGALPSWLSKALACIFIAVVCASGLFYGKSPGTMKIQLEGRDFHATAWESQKHFFAPHNYGLPDVLRYHYAFKSRKAVQSGPSPLDIHLRPHSAWKDNPEILSAIRRTMGFFHKQDYKP